MGWLIALGILTLIAIIPVGIRVLYGADGPRVAVTAGPIRICVYPVKKRKKKERTEQQNKSKPVKKHASPKQTEKKAKGGSLQDVLSL